jgi:hypothetical protein
MHKISGNWFFFRNRRNGFFGELATTLGRFILMYIYLFALFEATLKFFAYLWTDNYSTGHCSFVGAGAINRFICQSYLEQTLKLLNIICALLWSEQKAIQSSLLLKSSWFVPESAQSCEKHTQTHGK